jgi:ribosome-associated heat shock protein Hsp15
MSEADGDHARLDVWLWRARFFKTRALATDFITRKGVRLARGGLPVRKIVKAGHGLALGDVLAFSLNGKSVHLEILDFGTRRGPPSEALGLYKMLLGEGE